MQTEKYKKEIDTLLNTIDEMSVFCSKEEIKESISEDSLTFLPQGEYKKNIVGCIYDYQQNKKTNNEEVVMIHITQEEYDYIKGIKETKLRKLGFCLIVWRRLENEVRDYVRFDFKKIIGLLLTNKEIEKARQEDFMPMAKYGVDFRVVGKKMPKMCYCLPVDINGELKYSFSKEQIKEFWGDNFVSV